MERTIRVTGKGKIVVAPDMIKLYITQSGIKKTHEDSIKASAECKRELNDRLAKIGFKKEDLKTVSFYVDSEYEGYHDKNDNYKRRFKGYKFTHSMNLSFPVSSNKLGTVLGAIALCSDNPEFSI